MGEKSMRQVRIISKEQSLPLGKIVCIARNYAEHIRELGNEVPDRPVFFMKPASSVIGEGERIVIPAFSQDCQHEVELAILIGCTIKGISVTDALSAVAGYGVAIDLTLRDVQGELKSKGLPWEVAKAFDTACPLSDFVAAEAVGDPQNLTIALKVNGEVRQQATTALMLRPIPQLIAEIAAIFTLEAGDVILTGTPAGVSRLCSGDQVTATIAEVGSLNVTVA
jgi:5-carboxymethyl-2-hydroxymuconate isomerase